MEVTRQLDRAIERIMGVEIEQMGGDNLAVLLCSHFDEPDDGSDMDDNGWSETATNAYEEIKRKIAGLFVPVREALTTAQAETAALRAREVGYIQAMDAMGEETAALRDQIAEMEYRAKGNAEAAQFQIDLLGTVVAERAAIREDRDIAVRAAAAVSRERDDLRADVERLEAEKTALLEVDRLAEIASAWHWWGALTSCHYEDKDDLFEDLDAARAKALDASGKRTALTVQP